MLQKETAFQELMPDNHCYGCGAENDKGLQIKSYWVDELTAECHFRPEPHHCAGPLQYLNGGIIATVIDCHCVGMAMAKAYLDEGRKIGSGEKIWFVTGKLDLSYQRPTLVDEVVTVVAKIEDVTNKKIVLSCELSNGKEVCVTAKVVAIRVPSDW